MSTPDVGMTWQSDLQPVLDAYLLKVGIQSPETRSRWAAYVIAGLHMRIGEFAADDIQEQAVERLREALDARLAMFANLDRIRERRELAAILAVLQDGRHAALLNVLFQDYAGTVDPETRNLLQSAIAADHPRPVPPDAPLAMPTQPIELRSVSALLQRLRGVR